MISVKEVATTLHTQEERFPGYYLWEIKPTVRSATTAFEQLLKHTFSETFFPNEYSCVFQEDLNKAVKKLRRQIAARKNENFDSLLRYTLSTNHIGYLLCKSVVTDFADSGKAGTIKGSCIDVTSLYRQFEQRFDESDKMQLLESGINAGIWDWDIQNNLGWWSDKQYQTLGYLPGEIDTSHEYFLNELLHPGDKQKTIELLKAHFTHGIPYVNDMRLKHKDGTYRWYECSGKVKFDAAGKPVRMTGILTEKHQTKRIREELERYQFLINESTSLVKAGSWEINFYNDNVTWYPGMYEIHETEASFKPLIRNLFQFLNEKDATLFKNHLQQAYHKGIAYDLEFESITAKGNLKWIRMIGKPIINYTGKIVGVRGITQDIHEEKIKDLQIKNSLELITRKNEVLNSFAQIVSHNLKSHANNISSIVHLLSTAKDEDERKEMIHLLEKISSNLGNTIDELSETVKIRNNTEIPKEKIFFETMLGKVTDVLRPSILETQASIITDLSEAPDINYVPAYLESILLNLISNAIKYRKQNVKPVVSIKSFSNNNKVCLVVTDNGRGIDLQKHKTKIFGMYKTFHGNKDARGVGLYITKTQIESLGGSIHVSSIPGEGTSFTICF